MELLSYLTLSMQLVIDYQSENVIVVKLTSLCVYMLWHATTDRALRCYHWGWTHMAFE